MATIELAPATELALVPPGRSDVPIRILSHFPSGTAAAAPSLPETETLRCLRAKGECGGATYGVWISGKAFARLKGVSAKCVSGVTSTCTDGFATGLFIARAAKSSSHDRPSLAFTYLVHDAADPAHLCTQARTFTSEIADLLDRSVDMGSGPVTFAVASCALRKDTPQGPVVAAVVGACVADEALCQATLLVGAVGSGVWRKWELGTWRRETLPATFIRPDGQSVVVVHCSLQEGPEGDAAADGPTASALLSPAEALQRFERVGESARETTAPSPPVRDEDWAHTPRRIRVVLHERAVHVHGADSAESFRTFQSRVFAAAGHSTTLPSTLPISRVDDLGPDRNSALPFFHVTGPPFTDPSASSSLLCLSYTATHAAVLGSYHEVPGTLGPVSVAFAKLPAHHPLLPPDRPQGAYLAFMLSQRGASTLCATELFRDKANESSVSASVVISANASVGLMPDELVLKPASSPARETAARRLGRLFSRSRSPTATRDSSVATHATRSALGGANQLLIRQSGIGGNSPVYLCAANGVSAVVLRVSKCALAASPGVFAPWEAEMDAGCGARLLAPLDAGAELRFALEEIATIPRDGTPERVAAMEQVMRRVLPALRAVGAAQKEVHLVQETVSALLSAVRPSTLEEWHHAWAMVTAMQAALADCSHKGQLVFTDRFFLDLAQQYMERHAASAEEAGGARDVLDSLAQVVSGEMRSLAASSQAKTAEEPAVAFVLEALASRTALVPLAEEVVRRLVETSTLSNGACAVRPKSGGVASCVHVVGALLLASCLDVDACVGRDDQGELFCRYRDSGRKQGDECAGSSLLLHIPVQAFRSQREFDRALVLAADMLCVPQEPILATIRGKAKDATPAGARRNDPLRLALPLLALSVSRRPHCLAAYFQLFAPLLNDAIAACGGPKSSTGHGDAASGTGLADNKEWLSAAVRALARPFDEEARYVLGTQSPAEPPSFAATEALAYVLSSGATALDRSLFAAASAALSSDLCLVAPVLFLFATTEKLVAAQSNFCAAAATLCLATHQEDRQRASQSLEEHSERLAASLQRAIRAWGEAQALLPYRLPDIAASYATQVRFSLHRDSAAAASGTIASRMLVMSFRLLLLCFYSQQLVQRMDRAQELCRKAAATGDEVSEFHPAVDGSLQALYVLHTLQNDCVPLDWLRAKLLVVVESVLPRLSQPRSALWARYFAHVLELSSTGDTTVASLKKRYFALLDTLRRTESVLDEDEAPRAAIHTYVAKADRLASSFAVQTEIESVGQQRFFILAHTRDSTLPAWARSHALASRQYLFETDWTDRLWAMEAMQEPFRDATDALSARLLSERENVEQSNVASDAHRLTLSPQLQQPLFSAVCELAPPSRTHSIVASTSLPSSSPLLTAIDPTAIPQRIPTPPRYTVPAAGASRVASGSETSTAAAVRVAVPLMPAASTPSPAARATAAAPLPVELAAPAQQPAAPVAAVEEDVSAAIGEAGAGGGGKYKAQDVAWWEALSSSPEDKGKHQRQDASQHSREEPAALSDTDTSYTTATSRSTLAEDEYRGATHHAARTKAVRGPRCCRSSSSSSPPKEERGSRGREGEKRGRRRGHCRCLHRHSGRDTHRDRTCSRRGLSEEPESPFVLADAGGRGAHNLRLLQFPGSTRRSPSAGTNDPRRPSTSHGRVRGGGETGAADPCVRGRAQDTNGEIALLSFGGNAGAHRKPHVRLFGATVEDDGVARPLNPQDGVVVGSSPASPFLTSATARMSVRYLEPPPLPSASVFPSPPPLLRLPAAPPGATCAASAGGALPAGAPEGSTTPAPVPRPMQHTEGLATHPFAQVPRDAPVDDPQRETAFAPPPTATAAAAPAAVPQPAALPSSSTVPSPELKRPILSPGELSDFRRYTDELKSHGTAAFLPVPVPVGGSAQPVASGQAGPSSSPAAPAIPAASCGPGYAELLEQHGTFLQKIEQTLSKQEVESGQFHQRLLHALQSSSCQAGCQHHPPLGGGLSSVEQANLVQNTIKQKNDLMTLNQQLLDIQLHAARSSAGVASHTHTPPQASPTVAPTPPSFHTSSPTPAVPAVPPPVSPGASAAPTSAPPPPIPPVAIAVRTPPQTRDAAVEANAPLTSQSSAPAQARPADDGAVKSITTSMAEIDRLNAELLSMNASAGAMERVIAETRGVIAKYEACRSMEATNAEGAALLTSLRHRTEAAERRLAEATMAVRRAPDAVETSTSVVTPWSTLRQPANHPSNSPNSQPQASAWLGHSRRVVGESEDVAAPAAQALSGQEREPQQPAKRHSSSSAALHPPPPPPPLAAKTAQAQTHLSGPLQLHSQPGAAATVLTTPASGTARDSHQSQRQSRSPRGFSPAPRPPHPPAVLTTPWDPSRRLPRSPLSVARAQPATAASPPTTARPSASTGRGPSARPSDSEPSGSTAASPPSLRPPTDLAQLYASSSVRHAGNAGNATLRSGSTAQRRGPPRRESGSRTATAGSGAAAKRFSMYRASASSIRPSPQRPSASPEPPVQPTAPTPAAGEPRRSLEHSTSQRFQARQHSRRHESIAHRMAQLEADLFS